MQILWILVLLAHYGAGSPYDFLDRLSRAINHEKRSMARIADKVILYDKSGSPHTVSVKDACMKAHNKVRKLHKGTADLKWDDGLAKTSADWALELAQSRNFRHSTTKHGENIFYEAVMSNIVEGGDPPVLSPAHAVFAWYQESWEVNGMSQPYNYNSENNPGTGHFTQIVWKGSKKVGCGVATVEEPNPMNPSFMMQNTYIVAQYEMPGNMMGDFVKNVMPLKPGAQHPEGPYELEMIDGCVNYGPGCSNYASMCNMAKGICSCTCS